MQVEIKEITAGESKHGKFKAVEFINSIEGKTKYFVGSNLMKLRATLPKQLKKLTQLNLLTLMGHSKKTLKVLN